MSPDLTSRVAAMTLNERSQRFDELLRSGDLLDPEVLREACKLMFGEDAELTPAESDTDWAALAELEGDADALGSWEEVESLLQCKG